MECIIIGKHINNNYVNLNTKNNFFKTESLILEHSNEKLVFKIPNLDYQGKTYTPSIFNNCEWVRMTIKSKYIQVGRYQIDMDESNEDQVVVYYEDKIN